VFFARKGQQGQMAGALYGGCDRALVLGAGAGLSPRADLAIVGDIAAQDFRQFVVNHCVVIGTKLANARLVEETLAIIVRMAFVLGCFWCHFQNSSRRVSFASIRVYPMKSLQKRRKPPNKNFLD
jgi:hypothetical protein